jgi:DNA-binding transcriptional regulator LsrR (DeoR family)
VPKIAATQEAKPEEKKPRVRVRKLKRTPNDHEELTNLELVSYICNYLNKGVMPSDIADELKKDKKIEIHREEPYRYIGYAARHGWIQFNPPPDYALRKRLEKEHAWLDGVRVVHTKTLVDVARKTAGMLIRLLRDRANEGQSEVHVGFAGGHAMRTVAQQLAIMLREPAQGMPETVTFHALVSGFDVREPTTDPNAFFTYLYDDPAIPMNTEFVGLYAPPIVKPALVRDLRAVTQIDQAFKLAKDLDIIVTSGASWENPCSDSMLRDYMSHCPASMATLEKAGCIGDILWRPISATGPIPTTTKIRAMTLIELKDIEDLIAKNKSVLFMLGPCRACGQPRTELLKAILGMEKRLITHLVTDSKTAAGALA